MVEQACKTRFSVACTRDTRAHDEQGFAMEMPIEEEHHLAYIPQEVLEVQSVPNLQNSRESKNEEIEEEMHKQSEDKELSIEYTIGKSTKIKRRKVKVKESEKIGEKYGELSSDKVSMKRKTRKELKQEILESKNDNIFLQEAYQKLSKKRDKLEMRYNVLFTKSKEWYIKLAKAEKQNEYLKKKIWQMKHKSTLASTSQTDKRTESTGTASTT